MANTLVIVALDMQHGGSVGTVAWRHAIELSRFHKIYVITSAIPEGVQKGIVPVIVPHRYWSWLGRLCHVPEELSFLRAVRGALESLCTREKIDLVWSHSHSMTALVVSPLKKRFGFQVVMTTHGDIFDRPPGTYSRELTWFFKWVTPRAYRKADCVQALSPYMAEWAVRGGANRDRVRVIPNGIDPQEIGAGDLAPRAPDSFVSEQVLRLLYVGSLWKLKGIDVLLRAVAKLNAAAVAKSDRVSKPLFGEVRLTLIGEGILRSRLDLLVAKIGLVDKTRFLGRVPRGQLIAHYRQADILCVPSISEALPTVTLEGMLCGLPVVGSNTGGIPFLIEHGVSGYLATPGDVGALAAAITSASSSRERLAELGEEGFRKARKSFRWPKIAKQLDELVRDTVNLPHGPTERT